MSLLDLGLKHLGACPPPGPLPCDLEGDTPGTMQNGTTSYVVAEQSHREPESVSELMEQSSQRESQKNASTVVKPQSWGSLCSSSLASIAPTNTVDAAGMAREGEGTAL